MNRFSSFTLRLKNFRLRDPGFRFAIITMAAIILFLINFAPVQYVLDRKNVGFFILSFLLAGVILFVLYKLNGWFFREELLIDIEDLRPLAQDSTDYDRSIRSKAATDLFIAYFRRVFSIHELSVEYAQRYFLRQDIPSSNTSADMTSIWSQIDINAITLQDPSEWALASKIFHDELGEIKTTTSLGNVSIPTSVMISFFRLIRRVIYISGSIQDQGSGVLVSAQIVKNRDSWAWTLHSDECHPGDAICNASVHEKQGVSGILYELSYHVANRLIGQRSQFVEVLPGDHFQQYTEFLKEFNHYLQTCSQQMGDYSDPISDDQQIKFSDLCTRLDSFLDNEPLDLRAFYMSYIISLLAIRCEEYSVALYFLTKAQHLEPLVIDAIFKSGFQTRSLGWSKEIRHEFSREVSFRQALSRLDQKRGKGLIIMLPHLNSTLGFVIERLVHQSKDNRYSSSMKPSSAAATTKKDRWRKMTEFAKSQPVTLEDAERVHYKSTLFEPKNPLFLSNLAEVMMKLAEDSHPKDKFLELRLYYRLRARDLLIDASKLKHHQAVKFAYLRRGHYALSTGDLMEAIEYYKKAWSKDKNFVVAARNLAAAYSMTGEYQKAIAVCDEALGILGKDRGHFTISRNMHGWIHNSRGWSYLLLARKRRINIANTHRTEEEKELYAKDTECQSWLKMAENDFIEAKSILAEHQMQSIPIFNLSLLYVEFGFLGIDKIDALEGLAKDYEGIGENDLMKTIYSSVISAKSEFDKIFKSLWTQHRLVPTEYLGILRDLLLVNDYIADAKTAPSHLRITALEVFLFKLMPQHGGQGTFGDITNSLEAALNVVEGLLPSCFLGLIYLSWGKRARAHRCWTKRMTEMDSMLSHYIDDGSISSTPLNHLLWKYLYSGLLIITKRPNGFYLHRLDEDLAKELICSFNEMKSEFLRCFMQSSSIQARENDPRFNSSYQYAKNLLKELSYIRDTVLRYSSCPEKIFAEEQMQSLMNLFDRALSLQKLMKMSHSMAGK